MPVATQPLSQHLNTTSPTSPPLVKPQPFDSSETVRRAINSSQFRGTTSSLCPDNVQANLLVLPSRYADDFRRLCLRNPVSCPLLGENIKSGDWRVENRLVKGGGDLRRDAPGYNIYKDGKLVKKDVDNCEEYWNDDSVGFLIGCSFTFEQALTAAGLPPRQQELGTIVPMYNTTWALCPSGIFSGTMVVSMRPYPEDKVDLVREISRPFIATHGEPVAWGEDAAKTLGIPNVMKPDYGEPPVIHDGEVPVFWACGVTPQNVVMSSPAVEGIVIGHAPGKMLVLDLEIKDLLD